MDPLSVAIGAGVNLLGGVLGRSHQEEQRQKNEQLQREFANNAISWKVADAKRAGIHPLYALGSPSISPSVSVQGDPLGSALSSMGADISRVKAQSETGDERLASGAITGLALERAGLQNELLRAQIAKLKGGQVAPPMIPPESGNFTVPENKKPEERPPLMLDAQRWMTSRGTSPMKAWEDQYGDDSPPSWIIPMIMMYQDMKLNKTHPYGEAQLPRTAWRWLDDMAREHMGSDSAAMRWIRHERFYPPFGLARRRY